MALQVQYLGRVPNRCCALCWSFKCNYIFWWKDNICEIICERVAFRVGWCQNDLLHKIP